MTKNEILKKETIVMTKSGIIGVIKSTPTLTSDMYKVMLKNGRIGYFKKNELKKV